jgi:hypothetical protein
MSDLNMPGREDGIQGDGTPSSDDEDQREQELEEGPAWRTPPRWVEGTASAMAP